MENIGGSLGVHSFKAFLLLLKVVIRSKNLSQTAADEDSRSVQHIRHLLKSASKWHRSCYFQETRFPATRCSRASLQFIFSEKDLLKNGILTAIPRLSEELPCFTTTKFMEAGC